MYRNKIITTLLVLTVLLTGCYAQVQSSIRDRNEAIGDAPEKNHYLEAKMMQQIESWKDTPNKITLLYINFPPYSDNVIVVRCQGVPISSTEDLEPQFGKEYWRGYDSSGTGTPRNFIVPVDGVDVSTDELAGRDATFGDSVPSHECLMTDGNYINVVADGSTPHFSSSAFFTFPSSTIERNAEMELRIKAAELVLEEGGCIDYESLEELDCDRALSVSSEVTTTTTISGTSVTTSPAGGN